MLNKYIYLVDIILPPKYIPFEISKYTFILIINYNIPTTLFITISIIRFHSSGR